MPVNVVGARKIVVREHVAVMQKVVVVHVPQPFRLRQGLVLAQKQVNGHLNAQLSAFGRTPYCLLSESYLFVSISEAVGVVTCHGVENVSGVGCPRSNLSIGLDAIDQLGSPILQGNGVSMILIQLQKRRTSARCSKGRSEREAGVEQRVKGQRL
jgi:hypothetical protein